MKKNNPCDDIQGQQSFDGLERTVRVDNSHTNVKVDNSRTTVKVNNSHIDIPKFNLSHDDFERLMKEYRYETYQFNSYLRSIGLYIQPQPIESSKVDLLNNKNFLKNLNNCCKGKKGF